MPRYVIRSCVLIVCFTVVAMTSRLNASDPNADFGAYIAQQLSAHAEQLFGFTHPLEESALGPYDGLDNLPAIEVAAGLHVSLVSSSVASAADQIAFWPDDDHPTHVFVCDEETSNPAVQRVDLSGPPASNATTIITGLSSCDPVRRTPWGTIIVAEENGQAGGLYELIDPVHIMGPVVVNNVTGVTSDPLHVVKRRAVGSLSFESFAIKSDGTMIYGDELAPSGGRNGGGIYKFVPQTPFAGGSPISVPAQSPLVAGTIFGLHVGRNNSSNWGQGAETGKGRWTAVDLTLTAVPQPTGPPKDVVEADGDINLGVAQLVQLFTGFYRPEDMDIDPVAADHGVFRACWANTGRMSNGFNSLVETGAVNSEVLCLVEEPNASAPTGMTPVVSRFIPGTPERQMYDNVAFQPRTGNLVVLEDGPVNVVTGQNPTVTERRGNDLWICLPDGSDSDTQTDGCVRFASVRDTTAEPSGFTFYESGEEALVNIQHRGVNDALGAGNHGALIKISGFKVHPDN
jgi:secreted PhoX family phosphatase